MRNKYIKKKLTKEKPIELIGEQDLSLPLQQLVINSCTPNLFDKSTQHVHYKKFTVKSVFVILKRSLSLSSFSVYPSHYLQQFNNNRLIYSFFLLFHFLRKSKGLVRSCSLVAIEKYLVVAYAINVGSVRCACRRLATFYTHAQNSSSSSK